jgi:hypothetical protein
MFATRRIATTAAAAASHFAFKLKEANSEEEKKWSSFNSAMKSLSR